MAKCAGGLSHLHSCSVLLQLHHPVLSCLCALLVSARHWRHMDTAADPHAGALGFTGALSSSSACGGDSKGRSGKCGHSKAVWSAECSCIIQLEMPLAAADTRT